MNKLPDPLQQLVQKPAQADLRRSAAAFILHFQSRRRIPEPVGTTCFSHQFLRNDAQLLELRPIHCEPADDAIRVKPVPTGSKFFRDIAQDVIRLMSRIKETLLDCVCPHPIRRSTTHSKRPARPWMIQAYGRLQTDTTMAKMQFICIESPSIQRLMGNTSFVV
jgi:hypothetical protein